MRIGFDAKRAFLNHRGLGSYSRNLLNALIDHYPDNEYFLYTPKNYSKSFVWKDKSDNFIIKNPQGFYSLVPSFWRTLFLSSDLLRDKIDMFHGISNELPFGVANKTSAVVTIHDLMFMRCPQNFALVDRKAYAIKTQMALKGAQHIIAISQQTKNDIINYLHVDEKKISVIYQSISQKFKKSFTDDEVLAIKQKFNLRESYFLYVGALEENKNILNLIEAFGRLKKDLRIPLVLVGKGKTEYVKKIKEAAIKNNVIKEVIFLEGVNDLELPVIYKNAHALILPSFYEGFGIPALEAIVSSTPVLLSNIPSLVEIAQDAGIYFNPASVEDMALQIEKIITDQDLYAEKKKALKNRAPLFSDYEFAKQVMDVYLKN